MEAPRRKKALIIALVVVFAVVVVAAIAIGVAVGLRSNAEPPAPNSEDVKLAPKVLPYDKSQIVEDGHWNFLMDTTGKDRIDEVYHDFETKPGTNWTITGTFESVGVFSMKCTKEILEKEALPLPHMQSNVIYVEPVYKRTISRAVASALYGLDRLDQNAVNPRDNQYNVPGNLNGAGVTVYVLDTGIRGTHSEFVGRMAAGQDFIGDGRGTTDCNGHGTHCAGTIAGATFGVATGAKVAPVRVLGCDGSGSSQGVINGINWVTANAKKPAVASMSLGGGKSATENNAVERAVAAGIPFAVAAGNENADACNTSPASATNALTVGASDSTDKRASFSNWGTCLDIFAPGVNILSAGITTDTASATLSGTSMACPHVAGVMALTLSKTPTLSGVGVNNAIIAGSLAGKITDPRAGSPNRLLNVAFLGNGAAPAPAPQPAPQPAPAPSPPAGQATAQGNFAVRGQVQFHPNGRSFRTTATKALSATLVGPGGNVDYDLALMKFTNGVWTIVAESIGSTAREAITSTQTAGDYTWRVLNFNGAGAYTLTFTNA